MMNSVEIMENLQTKNKIVAFVVVFLLIALISFFHYTATLQGMLPLHDLFRRLYYLPIIIASIVFPFRLALMVPILITIIYIPHTIQQYQFDSSTLLDNVVEIFLFNFIAVFSALLVNSLKERQMLLEKTTQELHESLKIIKDQSEYMANQETQIERAERLAVLGELTSMLAHEVRNPLNTIRGIGDILKQYTTNLPELKEFVEILNKETSHINRVISNYLNFAREKASQEGYILLPSELENSLLIVRRLARHKRIKLHTEIRLQKPCSVKISPTHFHQVILNLMKNALEASSPGQIVLIKCEKSEPDRIVLIIEDRGEGIEKEDLEHIFQPFFTTKAQGTGLGLTITRRILEKYGHRIRVFSSKGKGTKFVVEFQICKEIPEKLKSLSEANVSDN